MARIFGALQSRLLATLADVIDGDFEVVESREREWASATFCGARHSFDLRLSIASADAPLPDGLSQLSDVEFDLQGSIVADCCVREIVRSRDPDGDNLALIRVEFLTIEDR